MTDTAPDNTLPSLDPNALLAGELNPTKLDAFRAAVFQSVEKLQELRDWLSEPRAKGVARGVALWALGMHQEAVPLLQADKANPTVALCLASSLAALGNLDEAQKVLQKRDSDPAQALVWLRALDTNNHAEALSKDAPALSPLLGAADRKYFEGRAYELNHEISKAIACFDEVLGHDGNHKQTLFRLALNVDLRGEDEEARELYERALMCPPVNIACVINLGILYEDMGNYRRAMQCFDLALQTHPDNARARLYRRDAAAALNMYYDEDQERRDDKRNKLLRTPINDFELSVRSRNCLAKMNIRTLGDLVKKTEAELLSYKNFGETSLTEIKEILKNKGLRLGMTSDELMSKDLGEIAEPQLRPEEQPDPNSPDPTRRPVSELDLSVRSRRIVDLLKIRTIGDLAQKTEAELLACPNFGQTSLNEIKTKLDEFGLSLRG
ncbi:MAG: tetratricopeptide repeat protein [Planctomycetes bacterium]|nr:tetratricopeptide repeat protein [Planctomycetota bacterium]MCC7396082.1 tetratricopeptide repeat protein [Planctomycetota bacterium]